MSVFFFSFGFPDTGRYVRTVVIIIRMTGASGSRLLYTILCKATQFRVVQSKRGRKFESGQGV